ncbi:hypothetical protein [Thalassoglobus sp.]|uniref:hypothetical protein n=1 Tax=Thalassoglobus sp. TaxID=2795869 RepID=UPI003AA84D2B
MLECPTCGSLLRFEGDPHFCEPHRGDHLRFNLPQTEEERVMVSEGVRKIHNIPESYWYRNRPGDLAIVKRLRAEQQSQMEGE